jgi:addiction module RelB/DinJ family antitoxin
MDDDLRREADAILDELGLNMSSAVNIFVRQLVRQGGLPFTPALRTHKTTKELQKEQLDTLLNFASDNRRLESGYVFNRDECYDR